MLDEEDKDAEGAEDEDAKLWEIFEAVSCCRTPPAPLGAPQPPRPRPAAPGAVALGGHLPVAVPRCSRPLPGQRPAASGAAAAPSERELRSSLQGVAEQSSQSALKLRAVQFCGREKGQACTCP